MSPVGEFDVDVTEGIDVGLGVASEAPQLFDGQRFAGAGVVGTCRPTSAATRALQCSAVRLREDDYGQRVAGARGFRRDVAVVFVDFLEVACRFDDSEDRIDGLYFVVVEQLVS